MHINIKLLCADINIYRNNVCWQSGNSAKNARTDMYVANDNQFCSLQFCVFFSYEEEYTNITVFTLKLKKQQHVIVWLCIGTQGIIWKKLLLATTFKKAFTECYNHVLTSNKKIWASREAWCKLYAFKRLTYSLGLFYSHLQYYSAIMELWQTQYAD